MSHFKLTSSVIFLSPVWIDLRQVNLKIRLSQFPEEPDLRLEGLNLGNLKHFVVKDFTSSSNKEFEFLSFLPLPSSSERWAASSS